MTSKYSQVVRDTSGKYPWDCVASASARAVDPTISMTISKCSATINYKTSATQRELIHLLAWHVSPTTLLGTHRGSAGSMSTSPGAFVSASGGRWPGVLQPALPRAGEASGVAPVQNNKIAHG